VRITVLESPTATAEFREALRAALQELPHETDYSTDGGTNVLSRSRHADAIVILDSELNKTTMLHIGWCLRTLPALIVCDAPTKSMFHKASASDFRMLSWDGEMETLYDFLKQGLEAIERDPDPYRSQYARQVEAPTEPVRDTVFISYSHKDTQHLERLLIHLEPLRRSGRVKYWSDQQLKPGSRWREEIANAISNAAVAVLLVSPDFLASEFISAKELPSLLKAAKEDGAVVLPVVVRPCRFTRDPELSDFQAVNEARPVAALSDVLQDQVWDEVASEIERRVGPPQIDSTLGVDK
jgi:hypothetical protein